MTSTRSTRRTLSGVVTSTKATKTITVEVERTYRHPKYGKYVRKNKRYLVHDEKETASLGDTVTIGAARPLSARKRYRLVEVTTKGGLITADPKDVGKVDLSPDAPVNASGDASGDDGGAA